MGIHLGAGPLKIGRPLLKATITWRGRWEEGGPMRSRDLDESRDGAGRLGPRDMRRGGRGAEGRPRRRRRWRAAAVTEVVAAGSAASGRAPRPAPPSVGRHSADPRPPPLCTSPAPGRLCPRSRGGVRVCAGAAGALRPVGWAAEPGSARARPWRAAARGAVVSGRRR